MLNRPSVSAAAGQAGADGDSGASAAASKEGADAHGLGDAAGLGDAGGLADAGGLGLRVGGRLRRAEREVERRCQRRGGEIGDARLWNGHHNRPELRRHDGARALISGRAAGQRLAVGGPDREDDKALTHRGGRRRSATRPAARLRLERIGHGDDVDPGSGRERSADRLRRVDRQREGDLAGAERSAKAERALTRVVLERAEVDVLAGEDRRRGIAADDRVERASGLSRGVAGADPDDLQHVRRDRGEDRDVRARPNDLGPGLGEIGEDAGAERCDQEDHDVGGPTTAHGSLLSPSA